MNESDRPIRVVFADDHPTTRAGIRAALEQAPDIAVVGEATDGLEAQRMVADLHPDVLLLDLVMPGLRPAEIERWVRNHCSRTTVLILTAHDRDCFLAQAVEAGVVGYLVKTERVQQIVEAIRCAARGEVLITGGQLARAMRWQQEVGARWESLTEREREVLRLLAQGLDNQAIAQRLWHSPQDGRVSRHAHPGQTGRALTPGSRRVGLHPPGGAAAILRRLREIPDVSIIRGIPRRAYQDWVSVVFLHPLARAGLQTTPDAARPATV